MRVLRLFLSSGHNFVGRFGQSPRSNPLREVERAECVAGWGLRGDRYFGHRTDYKGQVTFFSIEVLEALGRELGLDPLHPGVHRRNVLVSGVDLNALVLEIVPLLDRAGLKRVQVEADLKPTLETLQGDAGSLSHAIMNLCVNALDAMPDGGKLVIRTRHRVGGGYDLCVQDTGMGMTEEVRLRACEPFFTTKAVGKGTGLGLSMAYGVMQAHGGHMSLASELGRGTEVSLHFPPPPVVLAPQARKAPTTVEAPSAPLRILLVDDDELIRESLAPMLEELLGHQVDTAASGLEALDKLAAGLEVDLVILDMNMPGLDGAHTLERLLERSPGQAVLMATGNSEMAIADALAGHPNVAGIQKPFSATELDRAFRDLRSRIASELETS